MPIQNYSLLKGDPVSGRVVFNARGKNPHFHIQIQASGQTFDAALNIQSDDGSEVLFAINNSLTPPQPQALLDQAEGIAPLAREPGGLALDFVRETVGSAQMIDPSTMQLLPVGVPPGHPKNDLHNAVVDILEQAIADADGTMYVFGQAYADSGTVDGIHDIHMNQGNPASGGHQNDNGTWQDGAVFVNLPAQNAWIAIFIAFQSESWQTDDNGDPLQAQAAGGS